MIYFQEVKKKGQIKMMLLKASTVFRLAFCGVFLMVTFIAKAQTPELSTGVDKQDIIIGEPFRYRVQATFPVNTYNINWLQLPDSIAHFEVIEKSAIDSSQNNGMLVVQQIITLTSFDSGLRTIPPFAINFTHTADDKSFNLLTDSVRIKVSFSPMDSVKTFHDIKTIIQVKDEWPLWMWIAAALSLLLVIFLIYYLFRKLRKKKPQKLFDSKLSPLEEAIQALNELKKQPLISKPEIKQFHSTLSEIFKRYLSRKTNAHLGNLTSEQVLLRLSELNINKENIGLVANNLRLADAVKFAKYAPENAVSEEAVVNSKLAIEKIDTLIIYSKSDI